MKSLGALAGCAGLLGLTLKPAAAEPPPETTRIRMVKASLCTAPAYIAEELLRAEGFSDVQYQPARYVQFLLDKGYVANREYALQTLTELPYGKWREYNPEDSIRFFGLRLHEVGMVRATPQKLIAQGTDWRFLNELKSEMKA